MVRTICDCGRELIAEASGVRPGYYTRCRVCSARFSTGNKAPTLCWDCKKATNKNLCPWAGGKPRDDWDAAPTTIQEGGTDDGSPRITHSFVVKSCPGFEEG